MCNIRGASDDRLDTKLKVLLSGWLMSDTKNLIYLHALLTDILD